MAGGGVGEAALISAVAPELLAGLGVGAAEAAPAILPPLLGAGAPIVGGGMGALAPSMAAGYGLGASSIAGMPALANLMPGMTGTPEALQMPSQLGGSEFMKMLDPTFSDPSKLMGQNPMGLATKGLKADPSMFAGGQLPAGVSPYDKPFDWLKMSKSMAQLNNAVNPAGNPQQQPMPNAAPQQGQGAPMMPPKGQMANPYIQQMLQKKLSSLLLGRR